MKCCLCGKEFEGYGNNPQGVVEEITSNGVILKKFNEGDRCCNQCDKATVIPHRMFVAITKPDILNK